MGIIEYRTGVRACGYMLEFLVGLEEFVQKTTTLEKPDAENKKFFEIVDNLNEKELDALPIGAIQLDGTILKFNSYESTLANVPKAMAIGKNFFKQVAPCTDVQEFYGRFKEGCEAKHLYAKFRYHFPFKQKPRDVVVTLFYSDITRTVWAFVRPLGHS